jgi:hypothetical protein
MDPGERIKLRFPGQVIPLEIGLKMVGEREGLMFAFGLYEDDQGEDSDHLPCNIFWREGADVGTISILWGGPYQIKAWELPELGKPFTATLWYDADPSNEETALPAVEIPGISLNTVVKTDDIHCEFGGNLVGSGRLRGSFHREPFNGWFIGTATFTPH